MFDVYFHSNKKDEFLANCADFYTVEQVVKYYLESHNYKVYYQRMWISAPGHLKIDFGSYSEFIVVKGPVDKIMNLVMGEE